MGYVMILFYNKMKTNQRIKEENWKYSDSQRELFVVASIVVIIPSKLSIFDTLIQLLYNIKASRAFKVKISRDYKPISFPL
jgi:hypothetical protein